MLLLKKDDEIIRIRITNCPIQGLCYTYIFEGYHEFRHDKIDKFFKIYNRLIKHGWELIEETDD